MSTERHDRILYGSNRIRAYKDDDLHWELAPDGFSMFDTDVESVLHSHNPTSDDKHITYRLWRMGDLRILAVEDYAQTLANAVVVTTDALPAADRPAAAIYTSVVVDDNGTIKAGCATLGTDGKLTVGVGFATHGAAFGAGAGGFNAFLFMYKVATKLATW
jgi:hypothetical protein